MGRKAKACTITALILKPWLRSVVLRARKLKLPRYAVGTIAPNCCVKAVSRAKCDQRLWAFCKALTGQYGY